jgi:hypothetical protein
VARPRARATEQPNQPLWFEVTVADGTPPGVFKDSLTVTADGVARRLAVSVRVFDVTLPRPGQVRGSVETPLQCQRAGVRQ